MGTPRYSRRRRSLHTRPLCSTRAGVRDDIARDVADGPGRRRPPRPHHARARAARAVPGGDREGLDGKVGRAARHQRAPRRAGAGTAGACPGRGSRCARSMRPSRMAQDLRHRHRRRPPLASHRLPRRVPEAHRPIASLMAHRRVLRSGDEERGAVRRRVVRVHAESARGRHPDIGRSDPPRHLGELHHQRTHRRACTRAASSSPHPWIQDAQGNPTRDPAVLFNGAQGHAAAARRPRGGSQGIRARAPRRSRDRRARGIRPRRSVGRLGRDGVRAGARSRGIRRRRRTSTRQMDWRRATPAATATPRPGGRRACACRASAACGGIASRRRTASSCSTASCASLAPWAERLGVATPKEVP